MTAVPTLPEITITACICITIIGVVALIRDKDGMIVKLIVIALSGMAGVSLVTLIK